MRITRLLGVCIPLALAGPATAVDGTPDEPAAAAAQGTAEPEPMVRDEQGREGRVHTVVRGDTLWDISETYLGSPWVWPKVWKANPEVRNPHWIYPGDRIWITSGEMRRLSEDEVAALDAQQPPAAAFDDAPAQPTHVLEVPDMDAIGLISADRFDTVGVLLDSPDLETMLSQDNRVYISLGEDAVHEGDRFTIVRENGRVRDPATHKTLGVQISKLGWLEVTRVGAEASEAIIRDSNVAIERGDRIVPFEQEPREIVVRAGDATVEGQVAKLPSERTTMGQHDLAFLNRGFDHGVEVGTVLELYVPGKFVKDPETKVKYLTPDEVIGNMIVVSAEPTTAVAVVTHATQELAHGEHFRGTTDERSSEAGSSSGEIDAALYTERTIGGPSATPDQPPASAAH